MATDIMLMAIHWDWRPHTPPFENQGRLEILDYVFWVHVIIRTMIYISEWAVAATDAVDCCW
jgi:hypothetical protein